MLSHALWQSISSRDCWVITEQQSGHPLMYCAGLWDEARWERGGGELGRRTGRHARFGVKDGEKNKQKVLYRQLHHNPLNLTARAASLAMFCPLNHLFIQHNLTHTHTLLTGCHSAAIWLSVSKNLHLSGVGNLKTIVLSVTTPCLRHPRARGITILQHDLGKMIIVST